MTTVFTHTNLNSLAVRWMVRSDRDECLRIEEESSLYPWLAHDFDAALHSRPCIGLVVEPESLDRVLGHCVHDIHETHLEILTLAVGRPYWRQSVGTALLLRLVARLGRERQRITVRVPEVDMPRLKFFQHFGFRAVRVERGRRDDYGLDKVVMELRI